MEGILSKLQEWVVLYGVNVVGAIVILIIGRWAAMVIRALVRKVLQRNRVDETLISFAASLTYAAVMAFVVIAALAKLGIQTTSFIAVLGAAGLAVRMCICTKPNESLLVWKQASIVRVPDLSQRVLDDPPFPCKKLAISGLGMLIKISGIFRSYSPSARFVEVNEPN